MLIQQITDAFSSGDSLHELSNPFLWEKQEKYCLLKFSPSMLRPNWTKKRKKRRSLIHRHICPNGLVYTIFVPSPKAKGTVVMVSVCPCIYPSIRHTFVWSITPKLLNRKLHRGHLEEVQYTITLTLPCLLFELFPYVKFSCQGHCSRSAERN